MKILKNKKFQAGLLSGMLLSGILILAVVMLLTEIYG